MAKSFSIPSRRVIKKEDLRGALKEMLETREVKTAKFSRIYLELLQNIIQKETAIAEYKELIALDLTRVIEEASEELGPVCTIDLSRDLVRAIERCQSVQPIVLEVSQDLCDEAFAPRKSLLFNVKVLRA